MYYKALGWIVWKGGTWYLRRRYGTAPKKIGGGAIAAAAIAGAIVVAQKRLGRSDD
ncbi:hypothetical protein [Conexibacter arvalis]|uniref:Uncharacterized protein n=1 Tax=Conexibacter arvalis TaxID=912552 RepID=A0A840IN53_9ACTN|nr:hypothetical protein [Conexibacter arvalis]MBB4665280.1 hypothetical protein [Conexibacter arvalis]